MTPYFSRLAQRSGVQSRMRGRAGSAVADAGAAAPKDDGGYREQEQTLSVDPVSAQGLPAQARPAQMDPNRHAAAQERPAATTRALPDAQASTGASTLRTEPAAIDPYRDYVDFDAADSSRMDQTATRIVESSERTHRRADPAQAAHIVTASAADDTMRDAVPGLNGITREYGGIDRSAIVEDSPSGTASLPQQRSTVRALPTSVESPTKRHDDRREVAAADVPEHRFADDGVAPDAQSGRSRASTVRADAPQASARQERGAKRSGNLQVQIGRIEMEVVAPQAKTAPVVPQRQPVQAPAPAPRTVFNPHRHYLRGR
jgi:hypothetical protein